MRCGLGVGTKGEGPWERDGPGPIPTNGAGGGRQLSFGAPMADHGGGAGRDRRDRTQQEALADGLARVGGDVGSVADGRRQAGSGIARSRGEGAAELLLPRPAPGKMQGQPACRAGEPPGQGEEPPPEGLGGHYLLAQADSRRPAGEVMRHHLGGQPGGVGGEAPRGEMVQPYAVLEVAYRVLDLGVAAVVGLQFQGLSVPVGDEAVIAVGGEEGTVGNRAWASPAGR